MQDLWSAKSSSNTLVLEEVWLWLSVIWGGLVVDRQPLQNHELWHLLTFVSDNLRLKFLDHLSTYRNRPQHRPSVTTCIASVWPGLPSFIDMASWQRVRHNYEKQIVGNLYYIYIYYINLYNSWITNIAMTTHHFLKRQLPCMIFCWYVSFGCDWFADFLSSSLESWFLNLHWGGEAHPNTQGQGEQKGFQGVFCCSLENLGKLESESKSWVNVSMWEDLVEKPLTL